MLAGGDHRRQPSFSETELESRQSRELPVERLLFSAGRIRNQSLCRLFSRMTPEKPGIEIELPRTAAQRQLNYVRTIVALQAFAGGSGFLGNPELFLILSFEPCWHAAAA